MAIFYLIGLILSILGFSMLRKIYTYPETSGWGRDRVELPSKRIPIPMWIWLIYSICAVIPVANFAAPIILFIVLFVGYREEEWIYKPGRFISQFVKIFTTAYILIIPLSILLLSSCTEAEYTTEDAPGLMRAKFPTEVIYKLPVYATNLFIVVKEDSVYLVDFYKDSTSTKILNLPLSDSLFTLSSIKEKPAELIVESTIW